MPDKDGDKTNFIGTCSGNIVLPQTPVNDRNDVPLIAFSGGPVIKTDDEWRKTIHAYDGDISQLDTYLGWGIPGIVFRALLVASGRKWIPGRKLVLMGV